MIIAILIFVTAIHAMYCPNFSITGELLRNLWGEMCVQGYLSGVCYQEIAWFLLSEVILIVCFCYATYVMHSTNFSTTDELLKNLCHEMFTQG